MEFCGVSLLSVPQALDLLLSEVELRSAQSCSLGHAVGRILREPIRAAHDSPPFDTSAMDGCAVRRGEIERATASSPVVLELQTEVSAGDSSARKLECAKAIRINTGSPLPEGADAVVRIEDVQIEKNRVRFSAPVKAGTAIRRAGEDYKTGTRLLESGRRLDPLAVGLLASLGKARIEVSRKPRVALIASGDELTEPGEPLRFGQIYNSTRYALVPLLTSFGAEVHDLGTVGDSPTATKKALSEGLEFDVLVTTGGVSMGSRDLIRPTLIELGAREIFWKVKQRPGMPLFVGKIARSSAHSTVCFGLPGNPVSVIVTALVYVRAALLKMQGASEINFPWRPAIAAAPFAKQPGLTVFARADFAPCGDQLNPKSAISNPQSTIRNPQSVVPSPSQGSHQFSALANSAGLVRLDEDSSGAAVGQTVDFLEFGGIFSL